MNNYDLSLVYRIYPGIAKKNKPVIYPNDKYKMSNICINSLKGALGSMKVKIWVILDNCPPQYEKLFIKYLSKFDVEFIHLDGKGNYFTFNKQIEILLNQNDSDVIYFAEDDYLLKPNSLEIAVNFIRNNPTVDFLSIYDSLDYYKMNFHNYNSNYKFHKKIKWKTVSCTTLSFMTTKSNLRKSKWVFDTYSKNRNYDSSLWISLTKMNFFSISSILNFILNKDRDLIRFIKAWIYCWKQIIFGTKYNLWVPEPSLGIHLEDGGITPEFDYIKLTKSIENEIH